MSEKIYRIHPSIGFARVGNANSTDQFSSPTIPFANEPHDTINYYKQFPKEYKVKGQIKPQAAFFTIWEYDKATDKPLEEINLDSKDVVNIGWEVQLCNYKASWAKFNGIKGRDSSDDLGQRNTNPDDWVMKPLQRIISGRNIGHQEEFIFKIGTSNDPSKEQWIKGQKEEHKYLGQLITDDKGRLKVIGGKGVAASTNPKSTVTEAFNNPEWYDDVSDGYVKASITLKGQTVVINALPAWVIVGPPDFAPEIRQIVTLYDLLSDISIRNATLSKSPMLNIYPRLTQIRDDFNLDSKKIKLTTYKPHFHDDIYPILLAALRVRYVHAEAHDFHSTVDVTNPDMIELLSNNDKSHPKANSFASIRKLIFEKLRIPNKGKNKMDDTVKKEIKLTRPLQAQSEDKKTAEKDKKDLDLGSNTSTIKMPLLYAETYGDKQEPFLTLTHTQYQMMARWAEGEFESSIKSTKIENPIALDIASLENSLGGGFFPGTDFSWAMKYITNFIEPFRIGIDNIDGYGGGKDKKRLINPGYFSRQMGEPWQADFVSCSKNKYMYYGFWPSQRPDDVLVNESMIPWFRKDDSSEGKFMDMVNKWHQLGFVRKDPKTGEYIETERGSVP